jgi:hypothetical protein
MYRASYLSSIRRRVHSKKTFCHEEKRLALPWGFPGTQEVKRDALLNSEEEGKRGRIPY